MGSGRIKNASKVNRMHPQYTQPGNQIAPRPRLRPRTRLRYDQTLGLLLVSPWLLGLLLFKLLPILASLGISFTNFQMLNPGDTRFVGLQNYLQFFKDEAVGFILFETIGLALFTIPVQMVASLILAALLHNPVLKARRCFIQGSTTPVRGSSHRGT